MKLLVHANPLQGECLSSYLQRISKLNYVTSHDLWRLLIRNGTHYPQSSFSSTLDICPDSYIDLNKLSSMLNFTEISLENLTFIPVFERLGINKADINHSRVLSTSIEKHRKFCPKCIEENPVYKLIWQVQEVHFCPVHNIKLHSSCFQCNKKIPILPSSSEIGVCTSCNFNFNKAPAQPYNIISDDLRIIEDWTYLLNNSATSAKLINSFTSEQSLALRLLFITCNYEKEISQRERTTLSSIMQIAKNTKVSQTFIHLKTILNFVRKFNISLKEFFTLEIPETFINSVFKHRNKMIHSYSCIAPWCHHYQIPGSLERTSTSIKNLKSGQEMKYYMFCNDCGTEYALKKNDNKLIERGYFINFAWNQVKNDLSNGYTFTDLSIKINATEDKLRRSIIFLAANNLIDYSQVPIKIPSAHNPEIISLMKNLINQGIPAKQIQKTLCMKYNDFLFYWLSSEIRIAYLKSSIRRPDKCTSKEERTHQFENAVNELLLENTPITIAAICSKLNICAETLRNWGFLNKLKTYKSLQNNKQQEEFKNYIIQKTDEVLAAPLLKDTQILSDDLYKSLGIRRTVLVRKFPELTKAIHTKLITTKKQKL